MEELASMLNGPLCNNPVDDDLDLDDELDGALEVTDLVALFNPSDVAVTPILVDEAARRLMATPYSEMPMAKAHNQSFDDITEMLGNLNIDADPEWLPHLQASVTMMTQGKSPILLPPVPGSTSQALKEGCNPNTIVALSNPRSSSIWTIGIAGYLFMLMFDGSFQLSADDPWAAIADASTVKRSKKKGRTIQLCNPVVVVVPNENVKGKVLSAVSAINTMAVHSGSVNRIYAQNPGTDVAVATKLKQKLKGIDGRHQPPPAYLVCGART